MILSTRLLNCNQVDNSPDVVLLLQNLNKDGCHLNFLFFVILPFIKILTLLLMIYFFNIFVFLFSQLLSMSICYYFTLLFICEPCNIMVRNSSCICCWEILWSFINILVIFHIFDVLFPISFQILANLEKLFLLFLFLVFLILLLHLLFSLSLILLSLSVLYFGKFAFEFNLSTSFGYNCDEKLIVIFKKFK